MAEWSVTAREVMGTMLRGDVRSSRPRFASPDPAAP
jgi:hypothetical protein